MEEDEIAIPYGLFVHASFWKHLSLSARGKMEKWEGLRTEIEFEKWELEDKVKSKVKVEETLKEESVEALISHEGTGLKMKVRFEKVNNKKD